MSLTLSMFVTSVFCCSYDVDSPTGRLDKQVKTLLAISSFDLVDFFLVKLSLLRLMPIPLNHLRDCIVEY